MFIRPADRSSRSSTWGTSNRPYAVPTPSDRGACARFRMRRKVSRGPYRRPHSSAVTVEQLLQAKIELYRELNRLNEAVLQQARAFNEHVLSCTNMANNIANLVAKRPSLVHPLFQPENNDTLHSSLATLAPSIPSADPSPSLNPSTSASPPQTISTPFHDSLSETSISSSLPRLRGFFNKSKTKPAGG